MQDNIISTLVDCTVDSAILLGKLGIKFFKWTFDGWIDFNKIDFNPLWIETKLYNNNMKNKPILKKENHSEKTDIYIFTIPVGLSITDFHKRREQIAQFLHTDLQHLKIENKNNLACITIYKEDKIEYFYEDYEFPITKDIKIPLGINLDNWSVVYWQPLDPSEVHLFCGGSTGSGKSNAINIILRYLNEHRDDVEFYLQDCKRVDLLPFKSSNKTIYYNSGKDYAEETVSLLVDKMNARYEYLAENNLKTLVECRRKDKPKYIFYVIDELNIFDPKKDPGFYENLALLLSQGRAAGIVCIISSQSCYSGLLPGDMKNNINATLGLKSKTKEASKVICGDFEELVNLRGKGHAKFFTSDRIEELQVFNTKSRN